MKEAHYRNRDIQNRSRVVGIDRKTASNRCAMCRSPAHAMLRRFVAAAARFVYLFVHGMLDFGALDLCGMSFVDQTPRSIRVDRSIHGLNRSETGIDSPPPITYTRHNSPNQVVGSDPRAEPQTGRPPTGLRHTRPIGSSTQLGHQRGRSNPRPPPRTQQQQHPHAARATAAAAARPSRGPAAFPSTHPPQT